VAKKVNQRPGNKQKNRARRPTQKPVSAIPQDDQPEMDPAFAPSSGISASTVPTGSHARPAVSRQAAPTARTGGASRAATAARRTSGPTINYDYLRGDMRLLAMLAPVMVILVVIAFFLFH